MGMAKLAKAPVLLAGDIDRGGVFAALYGTVMLLPEEERAYFKGLVVNKFRGDVELLRPGLAMLEARPVHSLCGGGALRRSGHRRRGRALRAAGGAPPRRSPGYSGHPPAASIQLYRFLPRWHLSPAPLCGTLQSLRSSPARISRFSPAPRTPSAIGVGCGKRGWMPLCGGMRTQAGRLSASAGAIRCWGTRCGILWGLKREARRAASA